MAPWSACGQDSALTLTLTLTLGLQPAAPNCPCVAPTARAGGPSGSGRTQHVPVRPQPPAATIQRVYRVRTGRPAHLETEAPRHVWLRKPLPVRGNGTGVYSSAPGRVLAPYLRVDTAGAPLWALVRSGVYFWHVDDSGAQRLTTTQARPLQRTWPRAGLCPPSHIDFGHVWPRMTAPVALGRGCVARGARTKWWRITYDRVIQWREIGTLPRAGNTR
jgi:hypothetical protein